MTIDASADWRADLGGGTTIALIQAGVFTTDAGTILGPVPRQMWEHLVKDELGPDHRLTQALNCLLIETPSGRVLVETGVGERMDDHHRAQRGVRGEPILPSLRAAGFEPESVDFVALSHLHFDHAGGLLTASGEYAFPRARIVAQADEWDFALGTNARLTASYEQAELRLAEAWARPGSADGDEELIPGVQVRRTSGHSGGHQAIIVRGHDHTVAFFGRSLHAPLVGQSQVGHRLRRLPAHERGGQVGALRRGGRRGLDRGALPRAAPAGGATRRGAWPLPLRADAVGLQA